MIVSDPTGFVPMLEMYVESSDGEYGTQIMRSLHSEHPPNSNLSTTGARDGQDPQAPHPLFTSIQTKRQMARAITGTCYAYDFLPLFEKVLRTEWKNSGSVPTSNASLVKSVELVIDDSVFTGENDKPQLKKLSVSRD